MLTSYRMNASTGFLTQSLAPPLPFDPDWDTVGITFTANGTFLLGCSQMRRSPFQSTLQVHQIGQYALTPVSGSPISVQACDLAPTLMTQR